MLEESLFVNSSGLPSRFALTTPLNSDNDCLVVDVEGFMSTFSQSWSSRETHAVNRLCNCFEDDSGLFAVGVVRTHLIRRPQSPAHIKQARENNFDSLAVLKTCTSAANFVLISCLVRCRASIAALSERGALLSCRRPDSPPIVEIQKCEVSTRLSSIGVPISHLSTLADPGVKNLSTVRS